MPRIPGFEVVDLIGRGGFSKVYRAHQPAFDRFVAVKVLDMNGHDSAVAEAFDRECAAVGRLGAHPNVVTVFDRGLLEDGSPYLVMELMTGGRLDQQVSAEAPMTERDVVELARLVGGALETAHLAGILHRDVTPRNVLLSGQGVPALTDFGLATLAAVTADSSMLSGFTPAYAAPELLLGHRATVASDLYGLAATLCFALSGSPPIPSDGRSLVEYIGHATTQPPQIPDGASARTRAALDRALRLQPTERPSSVSEFLRQLDPGIVLSSVLLDVTTEPPASLPRPRSIDGPWSRPSVSAPAEPTPRWRRWTVPTLIGAVAAVTVGFVTRTMANDDAPSPSRASIPLRTGTVPTGDPEDALIDLAVTLGRGHSQIAPISEATSGTDRSAELALQFASLSELIAADLEAPAIALETPTLDTRPPVFARLLATNLADTATCRALRTGRLLITGQHLSIWMSGDVLVQVAVATFGDQPGRSATIQATEAATGSALESGAAPNECGGFDAEGLADSDDRGGSLAGAEVAYADLDLGRTEPTWIRTMTDAYIGGARFRFAHRLVAASGDRLIRCDVGTNRADPIPTSKVRHLFGAVLDELTS